jgi:tetratricopeptide (TPR) repeat protein
MVAALFALHPMHVESVAWAAERKDMLSAFFGLLCLIAYVRYCAQANRKRYVLVILTLALGLMSKPMLVTWPFVLLLLDYWPLRRLKRWSAGDIGKLLREKLPLFGLVTASIVITYIAQSSGGAVRALGDAPMALRLSNALVSYVRYLFLTFYPNDLAVFYPFNVAGIAGWQIIGALVLLVGITVTAWRAAESYPYFLVGWLWFVGTLVPVIGIVQVGDQIMADRYYYIPSIGLFTALVFAAAEIMRAARLTPALQGAIASVPLLAMLPLTVLQVSRWRDSETLYAHTLRVTPPNFVIEYDFGLLFAHRGDYEKATAHFLRALAIKPNSFNSLAAMGTARSQQHRLAEAATFFQRASALEPSSSQAHTQLGLVYANLGENEKAAAELQRGVELAPLDAEARANLGLVLLRLRKVTEASTQLREALRLNPNQADAHNNLGLILLDSGKPEESLTHFSTALRLKPDMAVAQRNIKRAEAQINARKK